MAEYAIAPPTAALPVGRIRGWKKAQATHFADGGVFDRIYRR